MTILHNDWAPLLEPEFDKPYYKQLRQFLADEYRTQTIYPDMHHIFNALHTTGYKDTKVLILGQDPYHGAGQAHGLLRATGDSRSALIEKHVQRAPIRFRLAHPS